jgi:hypothetical protein
MKAKRRVEGLVRKHNNKNHRNEQEEQKKIIIIKKKKQRRGRTMEIKDFISPPLRNLTKEVANLTKEMEENLRFSISLYL